MVYLKDSISFAQAAKLAFVDHSAKASVKLKDF
jgi:hypothetical protein